MDPIDVGTTFAAFFLELFLLYASITFYRAMQKSGAGLWVQFGRYMMALTLALVTGQVFILLDLIAPEDSIQYVLLFADIAWFISTGLGLLMILDVSKKVKAVLG